MILSDMVHASTFPTSRLEGSSRVVDYTWYGLSGHQLGYTFLTPHSVHSNVLYTFTPQQYI